VKPCADYSDEEGTAFFVPKFLSVDQFADLGPKVSLSSKKLQYSVTNVIFYITDFLVITGTSFSKLLKTELYVGCYNRRQCSGDFS